MRWLTALLLLLVALPARAEDPFPTRPVRMIVPFATGGPSDIVARMVAPRMSALLGQPVVVESRPGAGGVTGLDVVAKSPPDGHVLGMGSAGGLAISPALTPNMPYDVARDFAALTLGVVMPEPLVVPAALPHRTLEALVAAGRAVRGGLNYGSSGTGSMTHLAAELLRLAAGMEATHVPYRGGAPLTLALMAGEVQFGFADLPALLPQLRAGTLRALAIGSAERSPLLPEVPTMAELGLPGVMTDNWHGFVAPARTPPAVQARLQRVISAALLEPETARALRDQGAYPSGNTQAEFTAFIRSETERWATVIRAAGVKPE